MPNELKGQRPVTINTHPVPQRGLPQTGELAKLEAKAAKLHNLGRMRAKLFMLPLMADSCMDIMLSLFVGHVQRIVVTDAILSLANLLTKDQVGQIVDELARHDLVASEPGLGGKRHVRLTATGETRMRAFLSEFPEI